MPELRHFAADAPPEMIWAGLAADGGVVVEGLFDDATVERLLDDFRPHLDAVPFCNMPEGDLGNDFFGHQTKRLHGLLARSGAFAEVIQHPLLLAMAKALVGPNARDLRLSTGELMALGRGETDQMLHRDADSWLSMPDPRPEVLASANIALTDFTEANGATVVVPGSHRWPRDRKPAPGERARAVMPRGSALLYSGDVLHGGGANETDALRVGLYVGFLASWLRPIENHLVTNGMEVVRAAAPPVRTLLDCTEEGWTPLA